MKKPLKLPASGRLAMRTEGEYLNAYYALPDTMEGALLLGSIRLAIAEHPKYHRIFFAFMQEVVADIIEDATGERPRWCEVVPAPNKDRSGNA